MLSRALKRVTVWSMLLLVDVLLIIAHSPNDAPQQQDLDKKAKLWWSKQGRRAVYRVQTGLMKAAAV